MSSHSTFTSLPDEQELSAVSRNTEVDLFTHTEIKPGTSTGKDEPVEPEATFELAVPDVPAAITGTVVLTALVPFLFFGLTGTVVLTGFTGLTVLVGTVVLVVLVALVGITDTSALNETRATPPVAFATDTLDETHDTINKTSNRLPTTPPLD